MKTQIKEHPILFSGPMVRAIREGRKTQTRRVMKLQPTIEPTLHEPGSVADEKYGIVATWPGESEFYGFDCHCPYGKPGDRLWVRETFAYVWPDIDPVPIEECNIEYKADSGNKYPGEWPDDCGDDPDCGRWKPSIHMPRWASRILLEITDIRVERVQDISEADAKAEGAERLICGVSENPDDPPRSYKQGFVNLWGKINGTEGPKAYTSNPWVWVIEIRN